jgi:hypothetical protein
MNIDINEYLNIKIEHRCLPLFKNEHYAECALSAMKQVELNLNKKLGIAKFTNITQTILDKFSAGKGIKLKVPFGEEQQEPAKLLLKGAFQYYRNHAAHQNQNITKTIALRLMLIASELLDLLDACYLSMDELGGIEEIKTVLGIKDNERLLRILTYIDGQCIIDDACDGFFEELPCGNDEYDKLFELNLIYYEFGPYVPHEGEDYPPEEIGFYELTDLGREVVEALSNKKA